MRFFYFTLVILLTISLIGCNREPATVGAGSINASSAAPDQQKSQTTAEPNAETNVEAKVVVPAGTRFRVALTDAVSSDRSRSGDSFLGVLAEPIVIDGNTVFEKGTKVRGRVVEAKASGRVKGRASIQLTLTEIMRAGNNLSISTKPFSAVAEPTKKRDAAII